jgi:hypothetical protein
MLGENRGLYENWGAILRHGWSLDTLFVSLRFGCGLL